MRLIDADALMKTLGITDMDCNKCAWHDKEWSRCKRGSDFEDACCAIENAPTIEERKTGQWIPCSERLPEVGQDVLFSVQDLFVSEGCLRDDGDWSQFRWQAIQKKNSVTAWMPLPKPWRGDTE